MLIRLGNGRNLAGIESQVFRPIITAFCLTTTTAGLLRLVAHLPKLTATFMQHMPDD